MGETNIGELERAGAFENIKVRPENQIEEERQETFWKQHLFVLLAGFLLVAGWCVGLTIGEGSLLSVLLYAGSIVLGGFRLFGTGLKNLIRFDFDMRTLMTIAIIGAVIIGEWGEGAMVVILFAISEILESYSMDKARQSIHGLMDIAPKEAIVQRNGEEITIPVEEIRIGDVMFVKPGQKLAMDGIVRTGESSINQAAITGESVPVTKTSGDDVFAGTLNEEGFLEVEVTKRVEDTTLAKIIHLVEEAQDERAPSQSFIDQFARYYTPIIILVALGVATIPPLFGASWSEWLYQGLAVLVVGCPCALVISTPVSIVTAIGNAARNGVLIKGGVYLEETSRLKAIAFDKTGTLTKGVPVVTDVVLVSHYTEQEVLQVTAILEKKSQHPLASAVVKKAEEAGIYTDDQALTDFRSITGKGVTGTINQIPFYVGSISLFTEEMGIPILSEHVEHIDVLRSKGKTVLAVGTDKKIIAIIAVADPVRKESATVVKALQQLDMPNIMMLTGDHEITAKAIAQQIGIDHVEASLLPEEKLRYIKEYQDQYGRVAMVGDGVNDAPALAASTVGIAMGGAGTDTALETADIALMGDDLKKLPFTIKLSRKTLKIIKQNISFSIGIKVLALLLVIPGWLTLWIAIFADMGATLIVTLNGLRLLRVKDKGGS